VEKELVLVLALALAVPEPVMAADILELAQVLELVRRLQEKESQELVPVWVLEQLVVVQLVARVWALVIQVEGRPLSVALLHS
jgi:hypothetical protein